MSSPLPLGEGPGVRGLGREISSRWADTRPPPHPKPLSQRERGFTRIQRGMILRTNRSVLRFRQPNHRITARPLAVSRYRWFLAVGDSGRVISTSPASSAGRM